MVDPKFFYDDATGFNLWCEAVKSGNTNPLTVWLNKNKEALGSVWRGLQQAYQQDFKKPMVPNPNKISDITIQKLHSLCPIHNIVGIRKDNSTDCIDVTMESEAIPLFLTEEEFKTMLTGAIVVSLLERGYMFNYVDMWNIEPTVVGDRQENNSPSFGTAIIDQFSGMLDVYFKYRDYFDNDDEQLPEEETCGTCCGCKDNVKELNSRVSGLQDQIEAMTKQMAELSMKQPRMINYPTCTHCGVKTIARPGSKICDLCATGQPPHIQH